MKIFLSRNDVQKLVCDHFNIPTLTIKDGQMILTNDEVYWEGNPKPKGLDEQLLRAKQKGFPVEVRGKKK